MEALQLSGGVLFLVAMELSWATIPRHSIWDESAHAALRLLRDAAAGWSWPDRRRHGGCRVAGTNVGSWIAVVLAVVLAHVVMWLTMRFSLILSAAGTRGLSCC